MSSSGCCRRLQLDSLLQLSKSRSVVLMVSSAWLGDAPIDGGRWWPGELGFAKLGKKEEHERWRLRPCIYRVQGGRRRSCGPQRRPGRGSIRRRVDLPRVQRRRRRRRRLLVYIHTKGYVGVLGYEVPLGHGLLLAEMVGFSTGCTAR
jgi:hypothetical protein